MKSSTSARRSGGSAFNFSIRASTTWAFIGSLLNLRRRSAPMLLGGDEGIDDREELLLRLGAQALDLFKPPFQSRAQGGRARLALRHLTAQQLIDRGVENARQLTQEAGRRVV